jgi:hypothetical protein
MRLEGLGELKTPISGFEPTTFRLVAQGQIRMPSNPLDFKCASTDDYGDQRYGSAAIFTLSERIFVTNILNTKHT